MAKVAFLALTYGGFEQSRLMHRFFLGSGRTDFSLYIHPSEQVKSWEKFFCLEPRTPQTGWAQFSAVEATNRLLEKALEDSDNSYFIIISGSHCPLYGIGKIIDTIKSLDENTIYFKKEFFKYPSNRTRLLKCLVEHWQESQCLINFESFRPMSQWWVCGRGVAEEIVSNNWVENIFVKEKTTGPEEVYYKVLADMFDLKQEERSFCYIDWNNRVDHPKTFDFVDQNLLDRLRNDVDFLFFRKVDQNTKFKINIEDILIDDV